MLRLKTQQLPQPACGVCMSPWVDLTGAATYGNAKACAIFCPEDVYAFAELYLKGASARNPEASPLFGDLHGLPPLLIQVGKEELLFDEAVKLHEKATESRVECTLRAYPGVFHVWQMAGSLLPEAGAALREIAVFVESRTKALR